MCKNRSIKSVCKNAFAKIKAISRKQLAIGISAVFLIILAAILYFNSNSYKYSRAEEFLKEGSFAEAVSVFTELGDYKDSKAKSVECNRRILFDYLTKNNGYELSTEGYIYKITPAKDKIAFTIILPEKMEFSLFVPMNSDDGDFFCEFTPQENISAISKGDFKISAISIENDLEIDYATGNYTAEQMKTLVDSSCDLLCKHMGGVLEKLPLGITPSRLGFGEI